MHEGTNCNLAGEVFSCNEKRNPGWVFLKYATRSHPFPGHHRANVFESTKDRNWYRSNFVSDVNAAVNDDNDDDVDADVDIASTTNRTSFSVITS